VSDVREKVQVLDALPQSPERRRTGRIAIASPALIPLLRGIGRLPCSCEVRRDRNLAPAIGIAVGVVVSGPIWFTIGCILHFS
jgi:hypothetical protein